MCRGGGGGGGGGSLRWRGGRVWGEVKEMVWRWKGSEKEVEEEELGVKKEEVGWSSKKEHI